MIDLRNNILEEKKKIEDLNKSNLYFNSKGNFLLKEIKNNPLSIKTKKNISKPSNITHIRKKINNTDFLIQNNNLNEGHSFINKYQKILYDKKLSKNLWKKKNSISVIYKSYPKNKRRITIPCSPKLLTKFRTRPSMYKGHEEQELEDFKKQPKFHALPLNNKIFHKTFGIPEYGKKLLTIPHSPNLTKKQSKYSIQSSKECLDKISDKNCFSFNSCIYHDKKILKRISSHNNQTLISSSLIPFHLPGDDISKKKILEFKEKMQKEKEESERLRHFIAHPIPNKNEKNRRSKSILNPIPLVQPIPFNLITEKRGIQYQEDFQNNIIRKQKEEDKLRKFVAKPPISLFKIPFIISKSNKPLTEFKEINFETDIRAKKWIKYENHLKEKAKEIEKIKKQQEEYKKLCEKQWIKEQRKKTIIHANPIPSYIYKTLKKNNT